MRETLPLQGLSPKRVHLRVESLLMSFRAFGEGLGLLQLLGDRRDTIIETVAHSGNSSHTVVLTSSAIDSRRAP
jgi:hypothetical protein